MTLVTLLPRRCSSAESPSGQPWAPRGWATTAIAKRYQHRTDPARQDIAERVGGPRWQAPKQLKKKATGKTKRPKRMGEGGPTGLYRRPSEDPD